jgi:hypothetical protein
MKQSVYIDTSVIGVVLIRTPGEILKFDNDENEERL